MGKFRWSAKVAKISPDHSLTASLRLNQQFHKTQSHVKHGTHYDS